MRSVEERCAYFEGKLSRAIEGSDVWNINHAAGAPVEVAPETADVIARSLAYSRASGGLFDVTIGAVSSLWDFVAGVKPADEAIEQAISHVGYENVSVEGTLVTLADPEARLDLGGIAKGYIADDVVRMLREGGCTQASLSLGGNVYVMGKSFDGDEWNVGVQDPNGERDEVVALYAIDARSALAVALVKVFASGFPFGSPVALAYSIGGMTCAFVGMYLLSRIEGVGVLPACLLSAVLHNARQLAAAALALSTPSVFINLPPLALAACATGR